MTPSTRRSPRSSAGRPRCSSSIRPSTCEPRHPRRGPASGQGGRAGQRSLGPRMDGSLGLLPEPVLRLHRRVAVIAGSFQPSTATSILERGERRGILPLGIDVGDGLRQLAEASLLRSTAATGEYELLSTVRADALDRL